MHLQYMVFLVPYAEYVKWGKKQSVTAGRHPIQLYFICI